MPTLGEVVEEWRVWRVTVQGVASTTAYADGVYGRKMLNAIGRDRQFRTLTPHDIERALSGSLGNGPGSINAYILRLRSVTDFGQNRGYISRASNVTHGLKVRKEPEKLWRQLPMSKFPMLLDSQNDRPRNRAIMATALHLLPRQGEMKTLRIADVLLDIGEVQLTVHKTGVVDRMPIPRQLDKELRAWLTHYSDRMGGLSPDWYLFPHERNVFDRRRPDGTFGPAQGQSWLLSPNVPISRYHRLAQRALIDIGFVTEETIGRNEGVHTIRRSGARAAFDVMLDGPGGKYDAALRHVQALLHHKNSVMTERYLGLTLDVQRRNDILRGQEMYPVFGDNGVTQLKGVEHADRDRDNHRSAM